MRFMRPVLVFDGDCGFCTTCARFIERSVRTTARVVAAQFADLEGLGVTRERAAYELLWIADQGVKGGADAVAELLIDAGPPWRPLGRVLRVAPFRWAARGLYRLIARNRHRMPGGTAACAMPPSSHRRSGDAG
ncbi:MAG: DUF393 domain-containing protein [Nonomuraea sp.]|nr:DUF393 domain-containing protein [Nonomuraea sp.]